MLTIPPTINKRIKEFRFILGPSHDYIKLN